MILNNCIIGQQFSEGRYLNNSIKLLKGNGDSLLISEIVGSDPKLVLRHIESCCSTCFDNLITVIKNLSEKVNLERIIIISSYSNKRDFILFQKQYKFDNIEIYNVNSLEIPIESGNDPFFFIIKKSLRVQNIFIPKINELPELINEYLNLIIYRYQLENN